MRTRGRGKRRNIPAAIIQVVEGARETLIEDRGATQRKGAIAANGEAAGVDGSCLSRAIKLELVVGSDISSTALGIGEDPIGEADGQGTIASTGTLGGVSDLSN